MNTYKCSVCNLSYFTPSDTEIKTCYACKASKTCTCANPDIDEVERGVFICLNCEKEVIRHDEMDTDCTEDAWEDEARQEEREAEQYESNRESSLSMNN